MTDYHRSDRLAHAGPAFTGQSQYNHGENNRARQAAEALFAPKSPVAVPSPPTTATMADQTARRPRILSAVQARPSRVEPTEPPVVPVPPKPSQKIPVSHFSRIRTWMRYGMTTTQVADVCGVTIDDIERMLQEEV